MNTILNTVDEAIMAREKNINELTHKLEEAIKLLCHYDSRIEKEKSVKLQLLSERNKLQSNLSELHSLKFGQFTGAKDMFAAGANLDAAVTNGPGNCNAAQAAGRGPIFHEQNDAVDSH